MKKNLTQLLFMLVLCVASSIAQAQIKAKFIGRYSIGTYNSNGGVAEISAYDPGSKRMFVINGPDSSIKIVNIANPTNPVLVSTLSVKPWGIDVTSVACNKKGVFAISVIDSNGKTNPSNIVFLDVNGNFISKVKAGANADHVIFTPNGQKLLVANEGEPNVGYTIDPEGSVSVIDLSGGIANLTQSNVQTAGFTAFNSPTVIDSKIRIFGKIQTSGGAFLRNSTVAEDLEPESITISEDNSTAWATCQENNCIAVVNINTATVTALLPLGYKNHRLAGNGLDPSDRDGAGNTTLAKIDTFPVFGLFLPDGISSYKAGNQTYLVTANEGDARADWGNANNEEMRVNDATYVLDTVKFGGASSVAAIKANTGVGRLNVSNRYGDFNNDGKFDSIFAFGSRSFTIWNATTGALVWDSKDQLEQITKSMYAANFNCGHTTNSLDDRSDNKGPEPEAVTIGKILDSTYAFIALERIGGVMIYNITNPNNAYFVQYLNTRNFSITPNQANLASVGDLGPEGIVFIPRNESPNGKDMIILSNEVSGTVALLQVDSRSAFQMQVLHSSDMESGIDATFDAPNFAALLDTLEGTYVNTVKLASGDCYIPSPFLSAGEDASLQTPLRNTASSYFSGATSGLRAAIGRVDIAMMNIMGFQGSAFGNHEFDLGTAEVNSIIGVDIRSNGTDKRWVGAQFPYLSANLNFINDINLSYLVTSAKLPVDSFKTAANITANNQKKGIAPSAIIEMNGEKIGLVGATTQLLASISSPGATTVISGGADNMSALAAVLQPVIDSLRATGINKIIVMSHLQQLANEKALAPLLKGVDIIIAGGSHALCADGNDRIRPGTTVADRYPIMTLNNDNEPLAILNTTSEWKYIGRFVCDFDSLGRLIPSLLDSTINGAYAADTAMVASLYGTYAAGFTTGSKGANVRVLTSAIASVINAKDGNKFGKASVFLEGRRDFVRTQETNLGNVSADANLWLAKRYDPQVRVSIKNGGGIRSAIGQVVSVGANVQLLPTAANPGAGKNAGDISQLDIENSLRFNNRLSIVSVNAAGLKRLIEHAVSASKPTATPGQFPQVGGVMFSYDTTRASNNKIFSMVLVDSLGNRLDTIVRNGMLHGDTSRLIKVVTLNFLASNGDNYLFTQNSFSRVEMDTAFKDSMYAKFTATGSEQDAYAEYMFAKHNSSPYSVRDTSLLGDTRIQLLNTRKDGIFPETNPAITIGAARAVVPPNLVRVRGVVTRAWGRFIYIQDATGAIGVRQSTGAMLDSVTAGRLKEGDSVEVIAPRNDFNNYAQIQLLSGAYTGANTVIKLASNRALPAPLVVTLKQINQSSEQYESKLVRVVNLRTESTGAFAASTNYTVWDGSTPGDTMILRVISSTDTEMDDAPALQIPNGQFTFEGTLIQFCASPTSGCTLGYQLQGVRKKEIIPQLTTFNLLVPVTNSKIVTNATNNNPVNFSWNKTPNGVAYKWFITPSIGTFNNPWLVAGSAFSGTDTTFRYQYLQFDTLAAQKGIAKGDSVSLKWTAYAYAGNDSIMAAQSNNLWLVRENIIVPPPTLGAFNLLTPANNARVEVEQGAVNSVTVRWSKSNNVLIYKWFATTATGNFNSPIAVMPSNVTGTDTTLTLVSGAVDALLASLNIKKGDSVMLKWTVFSYKNGGLDSLKASQDFNVTIVRKRKLLAFNLTAPVDNARLEVEQNETTPVVISWSASASGVTYKWLLDAASGNFANPWAVMSADNSGSDTKLSLAAGSIDNLVAGKGVADGDSVSLKWTVRAYETGDSLQATQTFNIKVLRKKAVGLVEKELNPLVKIYPNPAHSEVSISFENLNKQAEIMLFDATGKKVATVSENSSKVIKVNLADFAKGIYLLHIQVDGATVKHKLIIE